MTEDVWQSLKEMPWEPIPEEDRLPNGYGFNSEDQRESARERCIKELNKNQSGANNRNAKFWKIVFKDGREIVIGGLQRWAIDNGYSRAGIKNIAYKKWNQYKDIVSVDEVARELYCSP